MTNATEALTLTAWADDEHAHENLITEAELIAEVEATAIAESTYHQLREADYRRSEPACWQCLRREAIDGRCAHCDAVTERAREWDA